MNKQSESSKKPQKSKSRRVISRFLSPISSPNPPSIDKGSSLLKEPISPFCPPSSSSPNYVEFKHEKNEDRLKKGRICLGKQRSFSGLSRFDDERDVQKENLRPNFGGSMRYTETSQGNSPFPPFSPSLSGLRTDRLEKVPREYRRNSDSFMKLCDSDSEISDLYSSNEFSSSVSEGDSSSKRLRKLGKQVPSRYLIDALTRSHRGSSCSRSVKQDTTVDFSNLKKFKLKDAVKSGTPKSPFVCAYGKDKMVPFSSAKLRASPGRNLMNWGIELLKSKSIKRDNLHGSSWIEGGSGESVHLLRLLHNRLVQWRFANARAQAANASLADQGKSKLLRGFDSLTKLRSVVSHKKMQLEQVKLELKLNAIIQSEIIPLKQWKDLESQYMAAISATEESLHSMACKVPLIEGTRAEPELVSVALHQASYLITSMTSELTTFPALDTSIVPVLSCLAEVVALEKSLLQECFELVRMVSLMEIEERSLHSSIIQLRAWQEQQH